MTTSERRFDEPEIARLKERIANHQPVEVVEPSARRAAVALILRRDAQLLFIQRAHYETDPWSGQVAFPGGREEPGDTSLMDTALRETYEEIGLDLRRDGEVIGQLDDLGPPTPRLPPVVVRPFVALIGSHSAPILSDEVAACFWVPLAALRLDTGWRDTVVTARGMEFTRRAFHHEGFVVWGMTERILSHFLTLFE